MRNTFRNIMIVVLALVLVFVAFGVRITDTSESCAKIVLGNVEGEFETGFTIVNPITTRRVCYPDRATLFQTGENENKDADYWDYWVEIKTEDGQTGRVSFNVLFKIDRARVVDVRSHIAKNEKDLVENIVGNYARSIPRDVSADFTADGLYAKKRAEYSLQVEELLREAYAEHGVILISFELRDVQFNPAYENSIEDQQIAQEKVKTAEYEAEQKEWVAKGLEATAEGEAAAEVARARGGAESAVILAEAEAEALGLLAEVLTRNPNLMTYEYIRKLSPNIEVMLLPTDGEYILPLPTQ